jgi:GNAT superfamily N-acetyltransferase
MALTGKSEQHGDEQVDPSPDVQIVRDDDPRCAVLEAAGYRVVGESWAARLRLSDPPDLSVLQAAIRRGEAAGVVLQELGAEFSDALFSLESENNRDYPFTPATAREIGGIEGIRALWANRLRVFGALDGDLLVAATVIDPKSDRGETGFTSVLRAYRGMGVGQAVKAASILALVEDGVRVFGTGGAAVNESSLGANRALGYIIEERWRSYEPRA